MATLFNKGSEWRKWDLHFHTPSSYDYKNKSISNQAIIDGLVDNGISVVVVTDHHTIDIPRIQELQKLGEDKITILPGIEFRSELGGSELMHYIAIFSETANLEYVWQQLQVKCKLSSADIIARGGLDKVFCDFKETSDLVHRLGGIITVHAGKKSNTIESLKLDIKKDIEMNKCIDILEVGKTKDIAAYHEIVFPSIGRVIPIITSSDNHDIRSYEQKEQLWIKADVNFVGLNQIIIEPDRVFVGDEPPLLKRARENQTKFIKSLSIKRKEGTTTDDVWFDDFHIELNSGLVAIIGNKGGGKSAITDVIGLCGNTYQDPINFSFLTRDKFRKIKPVNLSERFIGILEWQDKTTITKGLEENPDKKEPEKVKYIPQNFLEKLCTNVDSEDFERELKQIIYSHTPPEKRLSKASLDELIYYKSSLVYDEISNLKLSISKTNLQIATLEEKATEEYKKIAENHLKVKQEELTAHLTIKPQEPPIAEADADTKRLIEELTLLRTTITEKENVIAELASKRTTLTFEREELSRSVQYFNSLENTLKQSLSDESGYVKVIQKYGISVVEVFSYKVDTEKISKIIESKFQEIQEIEVKLQANIEGSLTNDLSKLKTQLLVDQEKLDKPAKEQQKFLDEKKNWGNKLKFIEGDANTEGSLKFYEAQIEYLTKKLQPELATKIEERKQLTTSLFKKKVELVEIRRELFQPVSKFIQEFEELKKKYDVKLDVAFEFKNFADNFFTYINQGKVGTFISKDDGYRKLMELVEKANFDNLEGFLAFSNDLVDSLTHDKRTTENQPVSIKNQLKGGKTVQELYDFIFQYDYLQPAYNLKLGSKTLQELSPGERGALLLIFYLILDNDDIPLIIDQPEENLDNESVYHILVHFIKKVKEQRQIVIVTHNPNLAIVCDADQIIHMQIEKENKNTVKFTSGGIEDAITNSASLNILEGTLPAFSNRRDKYVKPKLNYKTFLLN